MRARCPIIRSRSWLDGAIAALGAAAVAAAVALGAIVSATGGNVATVVTVLARIVDLARALGMRTVATGVDAPETFGLVQALRCDAAQGLALCPPLPGGEAIERLVGGGARLAS